MRGGDGASDPIWLSEEGIHEMPMNPDIFKYATAVRDSVTKEQQAYIENAYKQWSEDVLEQAEHYSKLTTGSSPISQAYYQQLYQQMQAQSKEIANGVYTNITNGMAQVSDAVVKDAVDWMSGFGFSKKGLDAAFSYIPQSTVNSLVTGSVYGKPGSWSLSAAIWGDNEKTLKDIYSIMSQGVAAQMPIEDIAKKLSQYVSPTKQLSWTGPNGMRIYKHAVDYNAQRLARTLVQHTYQQSFVAATKDNPFVTEYVWIANGSRVCPICADRDGAHYKKDKLPLDHPNGMCTMEPVVDGKMVDKLVNWVNSEDGTYPEIDAFASKFGYDASKMPKMTLADIKKQYGNSHYKSPSAWYKGLPKDVQQTVSQIHQASGKKWTQWYQDEIMDQTLKKTVKTTAKQADLTMQQMIEKYSLKLKQSSSDFMYLGKMSTDNMLNSLKDDELDDIAQWMAKKFGSDISTGSKKDKAVIQWIKDAFSDIDKMNYDEKNHLKAIANGVVSSSSSSKKSIVSKVTSKASSTYQKWIGDIKDHGMQGGKLRNWIDYMKQIESDIKKNLSSEAIDAIETYSGSAYRRINDWLRRGGTDKAAVEAGVSDSLRDSVRKLIKEWGEDAVKMTEDYVLRRGTDVGDLAGLFMTGDFRANRDDLYYKSVDELASMFVGQVGEYKGFTSTSSIYNRGFDGEVEIIMKLPKGSSGMSILSVSRFGDAEGEFLLNAGTKVICKAIEQSDGHNGSKIRVFLEVLV